MPSLTLVVSVAMLLVAGFPSVAGAVTPGAVTVFPTPERTALYPGTTVNFDNGIAPGTDGNVWFSQNFPSYGQYPSRAGRITTDGDFRRPYTTGPDIIENMTAGVDGNVWFTERYSAQPNGAAVGKITPAGKVTRYPMCGSQGCGLSDITAGPDGNMCVATSDSVARVSPHGQITRFPVPPLSNGRGPNLIGITTGPDGNIWFTEDGHDAVGRLTLATGRIKEFFLAPSFHGDSGFLGLTDITSYAGSLWIASYFGGNGLTLLQNPLGRMSTHGDLVAQYPTSQTRYLTTGPDGVYANAYFTSGPTGWGIQRIAADGTITLFDTPNIANKVTKGPDGNIWFAGFTADGVSAVGRVKTGA